MNVVEKALLLAHAIGAGVLVGSSTHLALQALSAARGRPRPRLLRVYPPVALVAWAVTFALGAVIYPGYRVRVRYDYLDVRAVWASILFDVKENLALFVGPLLVAAWMMSGGIADESDRGLRRWFAAACCAAALIAWWNTLSGLLIASVRSI